MLLRAALALLLRTHEHPPPLAFVPTPPSWLTRDGVILDVRLLAECVVELNSGPAGQGGTSVTAGTVARLPQRTVTSAPGKPRTCAAACLVLPALVGPPSHAGMAPADPAPACRPITRQWQADNNPLPPPSPHPMHTHTHNGSPTWNSSSSTSPAGSASTRQGPASARMTSRSCRSDSPHSARQP